MTSKGQVLIPLLIRNKLNIKSYDRVIFDVVDFKIVAKKAPTCEEMYGFVKTRKKFTDKQLEAAINKATEEGLLGNL